MPLLWLHDAPGSALASALRHWQALGEFANLAAHRMGLGKADVVASLPLRRELFRLLCPREVQCMPRVPKHDDDGVQSGVGRTELRPEAISVLNELRPDRDSNAGPTA